MSILSIIKNYTAWRSVLVTVVFFTIAPITLAVSLGSLFILRSNPKVEKTHPVSLRSGVQVYASLPSGFPSVSGEASKGDARVEIVRQYLHSYNSPLEPESPFIVATADKYSLDFRLTTAIAQQESNLCKIIPPGSYNCWGWGIHSQGTLGFPSFEQGIEAVSKGLREDYLNMGLHTNQEIMSKYTPLSNGSWAHGVTEFMKEME